MSSCFISFNHSPSSRIYKKIKIFCHTVTYTNKMDFLIQFKFLLVFYDPQLCSFHALSTTQYRYNRFILTTIHMEELSCCTYQSNSQLYPSSFKRKTNSLIISCNRNSIRMDTSLALLS